MSHPLTTEADIVAVLDEQAELAEERYGWLSSAV
jgi:hypothetical protein